MHSRFVYLVHSPAAFVLAVFVLSLALTAMPAEAQITPAAAQVPPVIQFSNVATDAGGAPLAGTVEITFSLYNNSQGGEPLWLETQNVTPDSSGHYSVYVGITKPDGVPLTLFSSGQAHWLGVQIAGQAEQPRVFLVSVPYAMKAGDAATVGGLPASAFMLANSTATTASSRSTGATATGKPSSTKTSTPSNPAVTGIGTASYIPMWDSTSDIVNSSLFQNSSQIGIGTTTPAAPLDVNGKTDIRDTLTLFPKSTDNALSVNGSSFKVSSKGLVTFTPTQVFPGTVTGSSTTGSYLPVWTAQTALGTSPIFQSGSNLGIGTATPTGPLDVRTATATFAVSGTTQLAAGIGVFGFHNSTTGNGIGIAGNSASTSGVGVYGVNTSTAGTGLAVGVAGTTFTTAQGVGVFGLASGTSGDGMGVAGQSNSPNGYGGTFLNTDTSGRPSIAVGGLTGASGGIAINGVAVSSSLTGQSDLNQRPIGVWGDTHTAGGVGVAGTVDGGNGVVGLNIDQTNAAGYFKNFQTSGTAPGVEGITNSAAGYGVYGVSTANGYGVYGQSAGGYGVYGINTASGYGVYGQSNTGVAILGACVPSGSNSCFNGVAGLNTSTSGAANGVWALTGSPEGDAVYMVNTGGGNLLYGTQSDGGSATFYVQGNGSGYFAGNLSVGGSLSKGGGSFKIDHPLDPANKLLSHSFVESPDMMNIYNGNVTTDENARATVELPDYFEALNRDFRYQLTVIGQFAQAIVDQEVAGNRFAIRTNLPHVKVSWQVTGIRHDAWANAHRIPNEQDKPEGKRGLYLYPELFGAGPEKSMNASSDPAR